MILKGRHHDRHDGQVGGSRKTIEGSHFYVKGHYMMCKYQGKKGLSIISMLFALLAIIPAHAMEKADEKRLDEVAERGGHVMPFDLEKNAHVFSKTDQGGLQQVMVKDKLDTEQIGLIRAHLSEISKDFKHGDFSKPAGIHGEDMPGLAELKSAKAGAIKIEYTELPDGAQISYSTSSPKLINAVHRWFDAQLSDHARHAVPGHPHQHMHHE